jgi:hypothetical protein
MGLENYGLQPKSGHTHLFICYLGCFCITMVEGRSFSRDHLAQKAKIFIVWLFTGKVF